MWGGEHDKYPSMVNYGPPAPFGQTGLSGCLVTYRKHSFYYGFMEGPGLDLVFVKEAGEGEGRGLIV